MAATTGRTVMVSLVLVVAIVAALVFGLSYMQRERAVETKTVETKTRVETKAEPKAEPKIEPKAEAKPEVKAEAKVEFGSEVKPATPAMPAVSPPASPPQADSSSATAKAETKAGTAPVEPPRPSNTDKPSFDITRVERSGDAVIAGRAAPGATVELLRDGELTRSCRCGSIRAIRDDPSAAASRQLQPDFEVQIAGWTTGNIRTKNGSRAGRSTIQFACGFSTRRSATSRSGNCGGGPLCAGSWRIFSSAPSVQETPAVRRGRLPRRQPLAHQPRHLRLGGVIPPASESKPGPNPRPRSHLSRPEFHPSQAGALRTPTRHPASGFQFRQF